jgi:hypothetical protein
MAAWPGLIFFFRRFFSYQTTRIARRRGGLVLSELPVPIFLVVGLRFFRRLSIVKSYSC